MKKVIILFAICLSTIVKSQVTTYTLNTNTDFSDFTIGGTPNNGTTVIQSSNFSPLTFTLGYNCNKTFISPTYTAPVILDSVVVTFSTVATLSISPICLDRLPGLSFPTYYPTNSTVRFVYYNTSSVIIQTLTINSTHPLPNGQVSIFNLNVVGYKSTLCPTPMTYSIQVTPPTCSVCCDGIAQVVNLSGGCSAPYTGQWNDGSWGLIKNNLCSGSYTVTVMDSQGGSCCPSVPQGCFVPTGGLTDISENNSDNGLSIFPNPTNSILNIIDSKKQLQNSTIEIKNYLGQIVLSSPFTSQINLSNLSVGMYFLTIQDKSNSKTVKIIKE